jgi:hypothetical protein
MTDSVFLQTSDCLRHCRPPPATAPAPATAAAADDDNDHQQHPATPTPTLTPTPLHERPDFGADLEQSLVDLHHRLALTVEACASPRWRSLALSVQSPAFPLPAAESEASAATAVRTEAAAATQQETTEPEDSNIKIKSCNNNTRCKLPLFLSLLLDRLDSIATPADTHNNSSSSSSSNSSSCIGGTASSRAIASDLSVMATSLLLSVASLPHPVVHHYVNFGRPEDTSAGKSGQGAEGGNRGDSDDSDRRYPLLSASRLWNRCVDQWSALPASSCRHPHGPHPDNDNAGESAPWRGSPAPTEVDDNDIEANAGEKEDGGIADGVRSALALRLSLCLAYRHLLELAAAAAAKSHLIALQHRGE